MLCPKKHHRETKRVVLTTTLFAQINQLHIIDTIPILDPSIHSIETIDHIHSGLYFK